MSPARFLSVATLGAAVLAIWTAPALAQQMPPQRVPPGWRWITDTTATVLAEGEANDTTVVFVRMPPGWHVTTGPGFLAYDPRIGATGRYVIELETFHFPNPAGGDYGVFIGGRGLGSRTPSYIAVLIGSDGTVGVVERTGRTSELIVPWARHDSAHAQSAEGPVRNVLTVDVETSEVTVRVNGAEAARFPRTPSMEGTFGLRISRRANVHVTRLDVTHRLAPVPR